MQGGMTEFMGDSKPGVPIAHEGLISNMPWNLDNEAGTII
jgi:hypothetical protein